LDAYNLFSYLNPSFFWKSHIFQSLEHDRCCSKTIQAGRDGADEFEGKAAKAVKQALAA